MNRSYRRDAAVVFGILSEKAALWKEQITPGGRAHHPRKLEAHKELLRAELLRQKLLEVNADAVER